MEGHNFGKDRLITPTDFAKKIRDDLVPPSHFTKSIQPAGVPTGVQISGTPTISWINPTSVTSGDCSPANPWLAITQAQQEILELRKENQRLMMLQGRTSEDHPSVFRARSAERSEQWSRRESEWRLEAEKHRAEAERLKGQVEALKETAERCREEMREKDNTLNRQGRHLEATREELCKEKNEQSQIREALTHSNMQKEKISSQLERLKRESGEEISKMRGNAERSKEEAREAELGRLQAEEEAKKQAFRLSEQLEEMQKKQEIELQQLNASHCAELAAARKSNSELQNRIQSVTSEVLQLKSSVMEISAERDGLREHLSQTGQAFEKQSATLHSLRNYIGQLVPEKGEKEQLNEAVERLNQEKSALQKTAELLTVRLNSVNEILTLQEEKMLKKTYTDPLVKSGSEGLHVLHLWREKVFKLCVQLRSKDIELREEKEKHLSKVRCMEQHVQQEQHQISVLQHTLDSRVAELDLQKVEKESLKQDLVQAHKGNLQLKSQSHKAEAEIKTLTEAVRRFSLAFENKVADVDAAQAKLNSFTQRLTFAKRRVETIQGLTMRKAALQKVQQASKQAEQAADGIKNLQTELSLVCEERNNLTQELKRTPELIEKALADIKEQYESKLKKQQQELEQSWAELQQAVAGREEDQHNLQQTLAQLEESKVNLEKLDSELLSQKEHSEQALQERVTEIEDRCAEKLREMRADVNTARREHTKAVMTLRRFEREAVRKHNHVREIEDLQRERTKREVQCKQLRDTEGDNNLLLTTVAERDVMSECRRTASALQNSAEQGKPSERSCSVGAKVQLPADKRLFSVLEELHTLSAAVVNSSEDSAEEEGQNDSVGPSTGGRCS